MKYIYLIECNEHYKIGITNNLEKRLKTLQTGNSTKLKIIKYYPCTIASQVESVLHRTYENVSGEWFILNQKQIENFLSECKQIENNILILQEDNTYYQNKWKNYQ
jgi:predicted GIY-YIG superfamily endonuclease